ncbi:transposase, partial [Streptomyces sp. NPDC000941]
AEGAPASTEITLTDAERALLAKQAKKRRGRARALERSRRATNTTQYGLSKKQTRRAERRASKGLREKTVTVPGGARAARADGVPKQGFRRDRLSEGYRNLRARQAEAAASAAEHRRHRARAVAREIIAAHGVNLTVEDCDIRTWYRLWGNHLSQTTPGMLIAALAAFVRLTDVGDPKTAYLDTSMSRHAQVMYGQGLEEALSESTTPSPKPVRRSGRVAVPRQRETSAHRTTGRRPRATPDETRPVRDHAGKPGHRPGCDPQLTLW